MNYQSLQNMYNLEIEGMPRNTIDFVDIYHITDFVKYREQVYKMSCCSTIVFILSNITIMTLIPIGLYYDFNYLVLYMIASPFLITIFGIYLFIFVTLRKNITKLLHNMTNSIVLKPYINKMSCVGYFHLLNTLAYIIFIMFYCISVTRNMQLFTHYTIAYVIIILVHIIAFITTLIYDNKYCYQFGINILQIVHPI